MKSDWLFINLIVYQSDKVTWTNVSVCLQITLCASHTSHSVDNGSFACAFTHGSRGIIVDSIWKSFYSCLLFVHCDLFWYSEWSTSMHYIISYLYFYPRHVWWIWIQHFFFCFCCIFCVWVQCLYFSFLSELLKSNAHYIYQSVYSSWSPICMIEKRMVRDQLQLNVSKRKKPFLHFISCTLSTFLDLPQDLTICVASLYQKLRNRDYEV